MQYMSHHSANLNSFTPIHQSHCFPTLLTEGDLSRQELLPLSSTTLKSVEAAGVSHVGYVRSKNEDCFYLKTQKVNPTDSRDDLLQGIFVLCDGMGGCEHGEVASSIATFRLVQDLLCHGTPEFTAEISLKSSLYKVNQDIYFENQQLRQLGLGMMGTTAVAAVLQEQQISVAHVGDSRCYRITASAGLEQLTIDHERGQVNIANGQSEEEAYSRPDAAFLTQALGPYPNHLIVPDVSRFDIEEDTLFLLCSDGLSDHHVIESHGLSSLQRYLDPSKPLHDGVEQLLDLGLKHNGHDNITLSLIRVCLP